MGRRFDVAPAPDSQKADKRVAVTVRKQTETSANARVKKTQDELRQLVHSAIANGSTVTTIAQKAGISRRTLTAFMAGRKANQHTSRELRKACMELGSGDRIATSTNLDVKQKTIQASVDDASEYVDEYYYCSISIGSEIYSLLGWEDGEAVKLSADEDGGIYLKTPSENERATTRLRSHGRKTVIGFKTNVRNLGLPERKRQLRYAEWDWDPAREELRIQLPLSWLFDEPSTIAEKSYG